MGINSHKDMKEEWMAWEEGDDQENSVAWSWWDPQKGEMSTI